MRRKCTSCGKVTSAYRPRKRGGFYRECRACENTKQKIRMAGIWPKDKKSPFRAYVEDRAAFSVEFRKELKQARKDLAPKLAVVLSDIHTPDEDKDAIEIVCDLMRDLKPQILVLNGDILDLPEVSRHDAGSLARLENKRIFQTFAAGNRLLDKLESAAGPQCTDKRYVYGNHEHRLRRWLQQGDNAIFEGDVSLDIAHRLKLEERAWQVFPDYPEAGTRLGKLWITHGQWCGKYPAARHLERYQTSVLVGHTHTEQTHHASTWNGPHVGYCAGYLADRTAKSMAYAPKPNNWKQGFALVYVESNGNFHVQMLSIIDGILFYGGRRYGRKVVLDVSA